MKHTEERLDPWGRMHTHVWEEGGWLINGCRACDLEAKDILGELQKTVDTKFTVKDNLVSERHTCIKDDGGTPNRRCYACENEKDFGVTTDGTTDPERRRFLVKDSGKRQEFPSGMVRNNADDKIDYTSVLDGPMFKRWAEHLTKAKKLYPDVAPGVANWTQASTFEELVWFKKSALRHFLQWFWDEMDEDHAAAVMFNINGAELVKNKMAGKKAA